MSGAAGSGRTGGGQTGSGRTGGGRTGGGRGNVVAAALAAAVTLAGTGYCVAAANADRALGGGDIQRIARLPPGVLPAQLTQKISGYPLTAPQRDLLRGAVWRTPMDQALANIVYVDLAQAGASSATLARQARLLASLGWRDTPSQQNLLLRDALAGSYQSVLDRGDALLRRRKLMAVANQLLAAMETTPEGGRLLVARLAAGPVWRSDYLVATSQAAPPPFLAVRRRTLLALMAAGSPVSRREIAPVLNNLVAAGDDTGAYMLWTRYVGRRNEAEGDVLYDGRFRRVVGQDAGPVLPFDWQLHSDLGYEALVPGSSGLEVNWDGKGLPVFATQRVPVRARAAYRLRLTGQVNGATFGSLFQPILTCGTVPVRFDAVRADDREGIFQSGPIPAGCGTADFALTGRLRDSVAPTSAQVTSARLSPLGG